MTQPAASLIDEIVREVLARLKGSDGVPDAGASSVPGETGKSDSSPNNRPQQLASNGSEPTVAAGRAACSGELAVTSRVVSLAEVEDRLKGIRRLVVPPGAVVTPSVRDELRRRNVALVHGRPDAASADASLRVVVLVLGSRFDPAPLRIALAADGLPPDDIRVERLNCLVAATDRAAEELGAPGAVVLLVSTHPAAAACLANRHAGVRAVLGIDPGRLAADAASVGANLLVLDPRTTGPFQLNQMAVQFCRQGPLDCPADLRGRLGAGEKESEQCESAK